MIAVVSVAEDEFYLFKYLIFKKHYMCLIIGIAKLSSKHLIPRAEKLGSPVRCSGCAAFPPSQIFTALQISPAISSLLFTPRAHNQAVAALLCFTLASGVGIIAFRHVDGQITNSSITFFS